MQSLHRRGGLIMAQNDEIRYLTPQGSDQKKKKYCRFKKSGIKYIDYKDPEFQRKVAQAVKKARHLALLPYVTDMMK